MSITKDDKNNNNVLNSLTSQNKKKNTISAEFETNLDHK